MKRKIAVLLSAMMLMGCTSCGENKDETSANATTESVTEAATETSDNNDNNDNNDNTDNNDNNEQQLLPENPVQLLANVWLQYEESEKFSVVGGDFSEENNNPEGAGRYSIADGEALDGTLCFPAASVDQLEDAASLLHMMNANTFTAAAFRVKEGIEPADVANEISANIGQRQWMCGIPDKYVIYTLGQDVVLVLGENDLVNTFCTKLTETYTSAVSVVDAVVEE